MNEPCQLICTTETSNSFTYGRVYNTTINEKFITDEYYLWVVDDNGEMRKLNKARLYYDWYGIQYLNVYRDGVLTELLEE